MIEFCSKKRMIAAVIILTIISAIILVMENRLPVGHEMKSVASNPSESDNASQLCVESEPTVVQECHICNDFQQKTLSACKSTNYIETIKCQKSQGNEKESSRSCQKLSGVDERRFWAFECTTAVVGMVSYGVVYLRQKRLERLLFEKVHRQIAAGV